jgi:hypothetical protein
MPLQPNIALQVQGLQLPDPLAQSGRVAQIQNALQEQRMGEMKIQNAMREQRREQDYETVLSGFKPGMSLEERVAALQQRGLGAKGAQYAETQLKLDKANREAEAARIKAQTDRIGLMGQLLSSVSDQSTLDAVRPQIARIPGVTEDDLRMLQTYGDGSTIKRLANASMTAYQRGSLANAQMTAEAGQERARAATSQAATAAARLPFERQRAEAAALQAVTAADKAKFERDNPGFTIQETDKGLFKVNKRTGATEPLMQDGEQLKAPERRPLVQIAPGEQAETVERGKNYVRQETDVRNAATAARKSLIGIESAQDVLSRDFETGFGTETIAKGASVLAALGVDKAKDFATNSQKFLQAATERVLVVQAEQKGVQTDQDAKRIEQMGARLGNTKAANEFILDVARTQAELAIAHDKFYRDWLSDPKNNNSLRGAENAWLNGEGGKSIFESPRLEKYGVLQAERARSTPPPSGPVRGGRSATPRGSATMSEVPAFRTVHEAEAANLPKGTRITVDGRPAEVN